MTESKEALDLLRGGRVWEEFCDTLKSAGAVLARDLGSGDDLDRAEGVRYLSRLTRLALEKFLEHSDPSAPTFYRLSHETAKIGCDNPDSFYQNAAIDGACEYRIHGTRGSVAYLGLGTYYGHYGSGARSGCSGYLQAADLVLGPDGSLDIIMSARKPEGAANWLPMESDSSMLIVRQNFLDRDREAPALLTLERIDREGPPEPLSATRLVQGMSEAARYVVGTASLFANWAEGFRKTPNELLAMDPKITGGAHGDPNIYFYMGYWKLEPGQALVIEAMPPRCVYWNFQLNNVWMESLDFRYHPISFNKHTTSYNEDGSFRLIVAERDPGLGNWVDTAGHGRGTMGLRWIKADHHPKPSCRVVALADLESGQEAAR